MRFPIPIVSVVAAVALAGCAEAPSPTGATSDEASAVLRKGGVEKVVVCHVPPGNPDNAHEITVGAPAVPAHLAHGDAVGECDGGEEPPVFVKGGVEKVVVCHVPPGNPDNAHEITVGAPAVPAHLAHGDEVGECGGDDDDGDGDCGEDCPV